ncbi:Hypothetical_protein [Hexamita inflata]|uniref:Hypothetical_protein n=1 Tax=Hexamita inflata TaxID=28002 RepID=A0AA86P7A4_9EUKA|nr:Hypothetical protein HINF_LOCUS20555 [Hexamita inflata]
MGDFIYSIQIYYQNNSLIILLCNWSCNLLTHVANSQLLAVVPNSMDPALPQASPSCLASTPSRLGGAYSVASKGRLEMVSPHNTTTSCKPSKKRFLLEVSASSKLCAQNISNTFRITMEYRLLDMSSTIYLKIFLDKCTSPINTMCRNYSFGLVVKVNYQPRKDYYKIRSLRNCNTMTKNQLLNFRSYMNLLYSNKHLIC